jgi:hypothetical protein
MFHLQKQRPDNSVPVRKNVRFEGRVKIHEFEKYLDKMSDGEEEEEEDYGNEGP